MGELFSGKVQVLLRAAGWFEGRFVPPSQDSPANWPVFIKAQEILNEFNGLHIGNCGPGLECATNDVYIDPSLTIHLSNELKDYERKFGTQLFALGEVHRGHGYLVIDEQGRTYLLSDDLEPFASSFLQALEMLLLGHKIPSKPR